MAVADVDLDDPPVTTDAKKGWSTECRAGNAVKCARLGMRCSNPIHGRASTSMDSVPPPVRSAPPANPTRAAAAAPSAAGGAPVMPPASPEIPVVPREPEGDYAPDVERPQPVALPRGGRQILEVLHSDHDDCIEDPTGGASGLLRLAAGFEGNDSTWRSLMGRMLQLGVVERHGKQTTTTAIRLTQAGLAVLDQPDTDATTAKGRGADSAAPRGKTTRDGGPPGGAHSRPGRARAETRTTAARRARGTNLAPCSPVPTGVRFGVFARIAAARDLVDDCRGHDAGVYRRWLDDPAAGALVLMDEVGQLGRSLNERGGVAVLEEKLVDVGQLIVAWLESIALAGRKVS